jgi:hypothetical protein
MFTIGSMSNKPISSANDILRERWKSWINNAYINWRGNTRSSIADFARYLNVIPQLMNGWMNYGSIPSISNMQKMGKKLPEVYDFFGMDRPTPDPADELLVLIPEDLRHILLEVRAEYTTELASRGMDTDSPEARQIVIDAFEKRGLKVSISE